MTSGPVERSRHPVIERLEPEMVQVLSRKTPQERLAIAARMYMSARVIIEGAIRHQNPEWHDEQVQHEIARRISCGAIDHVGR